MNIQQVKGDNQFITVPAATGSWDMQSTLKDRRPEGEMARMTKQMAGKKKKKKTVQLTGWVQVCRAGLRLEWHWCPSAPCCQYPAGSDCHISPLCRFHHSAESTASAADLWNTNKIKKKTNQITLKVLSVILGRGYLKFAVSLSWLFRCLWSSLCCEAWGTTETTVFPVSKHFIGIATRYYKRLKLRLKITNLSNITNYLA